MREFHEFRGPMVDWPRIEVIPGVAEALKSLSRNYECCVASNARDSDADLMGRALARVGIRSYFRHLFTSRELGIRKPDPLFFREVHRRIEREPQECVAVGDDYLQDIVPAKTTGMRTVLFSETSVTAPTLAQVSLSVQ